MLTGASVVTSCSLRVLLSTCGVPGMFWAVCSWEGNKKRQNFTGTYVQNRPDTEKPGKSSYPLPSKKIIESTPRELPCSDRAQTSTTGSGRPSCVDIYFAFWPKVLIGRGSKTGENFTNILIHIQGSPSDAGWRKAHGMLYKIEKRQLWVWPTTEDEYQ